VIFVRREHELSERQACAMVNLSRSVARYTPRPRDDTPIIETLSELAGRQELGFGQMFKRLRRSGHRWNHKRVYRVYCAMKLNKRRRRKRRLPARHPLPLAVSQAVNACWSADFMSDALWCGRRFRTFNVVDDFNREALAIEIDLNLPAARVIRVLDRLAAWRGYPAKLRLDNGPEFIAVEMITWAEAHNIELEFIQPGRPMQNGFIERFNRTYREAVLDQFVFNTLSEVRERTEQWMREYNEERPHESLGDLTPKEYLLLHHPEVSNYGWY
jgi:putative transposase